MNLPENGKVVIIDDVFEEALPLMNALSKKGISFIYLDGVDIDNLPEEPIKNVRIVFLDIQLGTEIQDEKSKISKIRNILTRVIGNTKYPYLILAWTKHPEYLEIIKQGIENIGPLFFLNMEKDKCIDKLGKFDLKSIENKINIEFEKAGIFHLFILWENIVNQAAGTVVSDISSLQSYDENWNKNMQAIFYEMAKAYSGKQLSQDDIVRPSLMTFNDVFLDTLESTIKNSELDLKISFEKGGLDEKIRAEINSRLMLVLEDDQRIIPGNVYEVNNQMGNVKSIINDALNFDYILRDFCEKNNINTVDNLFERDGVVKQKYKKILNKFCQEKRNAITQNSKLIELEISPSCDYYQDKWIYSRLVKGILWKKEFVQFLNRADYLYISPLFRVDNEDYKLVFDFRYLRGVSVKEHDYKDDKPIFRIRHELLVDIQSHLARHINRPGVLSLG